MMEVCCEQKLQTMPMDSCFIDLHAGRLTVNRWEEQVGDFDPVPVWADTGWNIKRHFQ